MDSFDFQNIKMEKANAKLRYRRLQKITAIFRLIEFCIFLIIISRFTTQLPLAFKISGQYFWGFFSATAVNPRFVFILGNAIIIVLFLKSGHPNSNLDFYDEYVKNCEKNSSAYIAENTASTIKQRKQSSASCVIGEATNSDACNSRVDNNNNNNNKRKVKIQRNQSEKLKRAEQEGSAGRELRRSATVGCRGDVDNEEKPTFVSSYKEDEMSDEEFKRTVEAFITRQQRALREEEEFSDISSGI